MNTEQFKRSVKEGRYEEAKALAETEHARLAGNPRIEDVGKTQALKEFIHAVNLKRPCTESAQKVIDAYRQ
jgi:hypothetical protein